MPSILRRERRARKVRASLLAVLLLALVTGCSASLDLSPPDATLPTRVPVTV